MIMTFKKYKKINMYIIIVDWKIIFNLISFIPSNSTLMQTTFLSFYKTIEIQTTNFFNYFFFIL